MNPLHVAVSPDSNFLTSLLHAARLFNLTGQQAANQRDLGGIVDSLSQISVNLDGQLGWQRVPFARSPRNLVLSQRPVKDSFQAAFMTE